MSEPIVTVKPGGDEYWMNRQVSPLDPEQFWILDPTEEMDELEAQLANTSEGEQ